MTFDGLAAMRGCTHLSGLRSLVLSGLDCMEGRTQALHAMVEQARGLTELRADMCLDFEGGWAHVRRCLDGVTSL